MHIPDNLPIPHNPTLEIVDSTKLSTYIECPRKFFYNYVLGWVSDRANNHLVFGSAVHEAMELLYKRGFDSDNVIDAFQSFLKTYRFDFPEETDELFEPKTPARFMDLLLKYCQDYHNDLDLYEVLFTEIAGSVSLDGYFKLYFKMDTILRDRATNMKFSLEHKTKQGPIDRQWRMDFPLGTQVGTYTHALYCLFPMHEVRGVMINGLGMKKTKAHLFELERLPIWKTLEQMQAWQITTAYYMTEMERDFERLSVEQSESDIMLSFPVRHTSCTKFFGCPYHDFCCAWPNPIHRCDSPPFGFKTFFWNPMNEKHNEEFHFTTEDIKE